MGKEAAKEESYFCITCDASRRLQGRHELGGIVPRSRDDEHLMLARAISASIADARARSEAMAVSVPTIPHASSSSVEFVGGSEDETLLDWSERCSINGCQKQLLLCHGQKDAGSKIGCAATGHLICSPCLDRWFVAQRSLLIEAGLQPRSRRECPICKTTLRAVGSDVRSDDLYYMGLRKLEDTWGPSSDALQMGHQ